jgi:L-rhamnose mutarotase
MHSLLVEFSTIAASNEFVFPKMGIDAALALAFFVGLLAFMVPWFYYINEADEHDRTLSANRNLEALVENSKRKAIIDFNSSDYKLVTPPALPDDILNGENKLPPIEDKEPTYEEKTESLVLELYKIKDWHWRPGFNQEVGSLTQIVNNIRINLEERRVKNAHRYTIYLDGTQLSFGAKKSKEYCLYKHALIAHNKMRKWQGETKAASDKAYSQKLLNKALGLLEDEGN